MTPCPFARADWSLGHWSFGVSLHAWRNGGGLWIGLGPLLLSAGVHDVTPGGVG